MAVAMATDVAESPPPKGKIQAGGGVASTVRRIESVSATVLQYFKAVIDDQRHLEVDQLQEIHGSGTSKHAVESKGQNRLDLKGFLDYMTSEKANAVLPAPRLDPDHPISSYFISSSHNSYLQGNQLWGEASAEVYANVRNDRLDEWSWINPLRC